METIKCNSCSANVVPRLLHYGGGLFTYLKTQHMCAICGVVMYETGGGIRRWVKVFAFLLLMGFANVYIRSSTTGITNVILTGLLALLFIYLLIARPLMSFIKGYKSGVK
jgi:ribosomal protein S27E